jgi:hypothetical protein
VSLETLLYDTLKGLVANRVYPAVAPEGAGAAPYITWQAVGGIPVNFMDGGQPSKKNARIQISVWAPTSILAMQIAQQAETALRAATALSVTVQSGQLTRHEDATKRHGTYQFFSCWADISA